MRFCCLWLALMASLSVAAQTEEAPYLFRQEIADAFLRDTTPWKHDFTAYKYARIGAYDSLLAIADRPYKNVKARQPLAAADSQYLKTFRPVAAKEYILQRASREQVIIINEAHHQPLHRTFTNSLLKGLYEQGYRYLGLEALGYEDKELNDRKYPLQKTGFYINEPQFGNLVREALQLGFTLFPYETTKSHNGKEREIDQARNIAGFMKTHPGKYLIHVGYAHVVEGPYRAWEKAMAGRLKEYTGIDPLTINQEGLTERSELRFEESDYKYLSSDKPAVLLGEKGAVYNGIERDSAYDIRLYHPRTRLVQERPHWLSLDGKRKTYFIDTAAIQFDYPLMVLAYVKGEPFKEGVPYDIIELADPKHKIPLLLEKGTYKLVLQNKERKMQELSVTIP